MTLRVKLRYVSLNLVHSSIQNILRKLRVSSTMFDAYTSLYSVRYKQVSSVGGIYTIVDVDIRKSICM